jgi:hypothetical protein
MLKEIDVKFKSATTPLIEVSLLSLVSIQVAQVACTFLPIFFFLSPFDNFHFNPTKIFHLLIRETFVVVYN